MTPEQWIVLRVQNKIAPKEHVFSSEKFRTFSLIEYEENIAQLGLDYGEKDMLRCLDPSIQVYVDCDVT